MIILTMDMDNGLVMPDNRVLGFCKAVVDDMLLSGGEVRLTIGSAILTSGFRLALLEREVAELMVVIVDGQEYSTNEYGNNEAFIKTRIADVDTDLLTDILMLQTKRSRAALSKKASPWEVRASVADATGVL